jgi:hypothetical protein
MFRSKESKKEAPKKGAKKLGIEDTATGATAAFPDDSDPSRIEVAQDLLATPRKIKGKTPAEIVEMTSKDAYRSPTDSELYRHANRLDYDEDVRSMRKAPGATNQRLVRTGYGGGIKTGDGSYLKFGSDDPQPMHGMKKGGKVKSRGSASGASKRGDGIAMRGKTKGRFV